MVDTVDMVDIVDMVEAYFSNIGKFAMVKLKKTKFFYVRQSYTLKAVAIRPAVGQQIM